MNNCPCRDPEKQLIRRGRVVLCLSCYLQDNQDRPMFYKIKGILDRMHAHYTNTAGKLCTRLGHIIKPDIRDECMDDVDNWVDMINTVLDLVDDLIPKVTTEPYEQHMKEDG